MRSHGWMRRSSSPPGWHHPSSVTSRSPNPVPARCGAGRRRRRLPQRPAPHGVPARRDAVRPAVRARSRDHRLRRGARRRRRRSAHRRRRRGLRALGVRSLPDVSHRRRELLRPGGRAPDVRARASVTTAGWRSSCASRPVCTVPLGDLDPVDAAPLTDAALTPYHTLKRSLPILVPGSTVVVIGAGGLGHLAVQLVRALTPSRLIVVDLDEAKRAQALELGADLALDPGDDAEARIRSATGRTRRRARARPRRCRRHARARGQGRCASAAT